MFICGEKNYVIVKRNVNKREKKKTSFIKRSYLYIFYYLRSLVIKKKKKKKSKAKHFIILRNLNKSLNYFLFISLLRQRKKKDVFYKYY